MRYLSLCAVVFLLFTSGCLTSTSSFYGPGTLSTPLLYKKNQASITIGGSRGTGESSVSTTRDVSAAYSPIGKLGLVASYHGFSSSFADDKNGATPGNELRNNSRSGEFGAGYYGSTGDKIKYIADIYGGYGAGSLSSVGFINGDMKFHHFFLQPGVGLKTNVVEMGLNIRLSDAVFKYNPVETFNIAKINPFEMPPVNGQKSFFVESAFTCRVGYKFAKFQGQIMLISSHSDWSHDLVVLSAGLHFNLEYLYGYFDLTKNKQPDKK
jgi:hypothetical protein